MALVGTEGETGLATIGNAGLHIFAGILEVTVILFMTNILYCHSNESLTAS